MANVLIEAKNLSKLYHLGDEVVHANNKVSLVVESGEYIALTGPSGSGKTTLLDLLGCIDTADSGELKVFGQNVSRLKESALVSVRRGRIGFIFQEFMLIPSLTVRENVALGLRLGRAASQNQSVDSILDKVGLSHRLNHLPKQLSGGERQRTAIARALVIEPHILIADEPTGNLDSNTSAAIYDLLEELNQESGLTIVAGTHDSHLAQRAKRMLSMKDGQLV
jgi:putative ABC transport system ATP-binding protein